MPLELEFDLPQALTRPDTLEIDGVFRRGEREWMVPAFWRGGRRWAVRFAGAPGRYRFRWRSRDVDGFPPERWVEVDAEHTELGIRGAPRVAGDRRHFEHSDGTPFFWLGDTQWSGLSGRLSWDGFQELVADRVAKGFTLVQLAAGLVSFTEDPGDPGYSNEGGPVWQPDFAEINPAYFDAADRRIELLVREGLVPAIVGGWRTILPRIGVERMKRHWRYVVARWGAYPVIWIVGGELYDPPANERREVPPFLHSAGWTEVARYLRDLDPFGRLITAHECDPPFDRPLQDEALSDFDLFQSGHAGWPSIGTGIAQITKHYARSTVIKPVVQGEIGYEGLADSHYEDFQRAAFWTTMLSGAAGFTYGAVGTWEAFSADKPLHKVRLTFVLSEEGMRLPGGRQVAYGARLLRTLPWERFTPRPDWVTPRGTTLLEPHDGISDFDIDLSGQIFDPSFSGSPNDESRPHGEWARRGGTFRLPYAAGVPGVARVIYIPAFGFQSTLGAPTVLGLEEGVTYRASYWQPSSGIRFDLGDVRHEGLGTAIEHGTHRDVTVVARLADDGWIAARVSGRARVLAEVRDGTLRLEEAVAEDRPRELARIDLSAPPRGRLMLSVRGGHAIASFRGTEIATTPILRTEVRGAGSVESAGAQGLALHRPPAPIVSDLNLDRDLVDAEGRFRGRVSGNGWDGYGRNGVQLLDAYLPDRLPTGSGDWLLLLEARP